MKNYFSGQGDGTETGNGQKFIIKLLSTETSKSITVVFNEDVFFENGYIQSKSAPFGSALDFEVTNPSDVLKHRFLNKIPLLNDTRLNISPHGQARLRKDWKIKITVHNSSGTGDEDAKSEFFVVGYLQFRRNTTI